MEQDKKEALTGGSEYEESQISWNGLIFMTMQERKSGEKSCKIMAGGIVCPVLRIEGDYSKEERIAMVMADLNNKD